MAQEYADKIKDVERRIEKEKAMISGAQAMRSRTDNAAVHLNLEREVREAQKNIRYLEDRLRELHIKNGLPVYGDNIGPPAPPKHQSREEERRASRTGLGITDAVPPLPPPKGGSLPGPGVPKARPHYTKLDLIKAETPHTGPKIQLMLQQLEFKLTVEKQYKEGIEKMAKLYQLEGDRRSRADAESKRVESTQKIQLLKQALKRYEDLHVDVAEEEAEDDDSVNAPNIRRPLSGKLMIRISAVRDVNHASTSRFSRGPETSVMIKVEDTVRAKTKPSRHDKWDEEFDIDVDKANELEITVYDKQGDHAFPIGLLWVRISDIVEELRRKKIEQEIAGSGWVEAEKVTHDGRASPEKGNVTPPSEPVQVPNRQIIQNNLVAKDPSKTGIDTWFALEPAGRIYMHIDFIKDTKGKRPLEMGGLGRQGAIRQKKEEVHEMYGHKFVQQQFYQIMRCAFCGEFLKNAAGMQCEDCTYTCHKKCYPKVVTKCISKSNAETDPEEEKLNHRIPHRFEPLTNISANWCCHCGYILPLGKKNAKKCSECGLTCHTQCAHLVPDFCGMSMEMANAILGEIKSTRIRKAQVPMSQRMRQGPPPRKSLPDVGAGYRQPSYIESGEPPVLPMPAGVLGGEERRLLPERPSYTSTPSALSLQAAGAVTKPVQPSPPSRVPLPQQQRPGGPPRTASQAAAAAFAAAQANTSSSSAAAAAAAAAAAGKRQSVSQQPYRPAVDNRRPSSATSSQTAISSQASRSSAQTVIPSQRPDLPPVPSSPTIPTILPTIDQGVEKVPEKALDVVAQPSRQMVRRKIGLDDFNFLAVLGKGNFGKVMLAEAKQNKQLYAIKVLKKEFIIENDEVESTRSEKRVFLVANRERHPFLLNLHSCFQTETRIYFVMEYISGGDLMLHIQREQFGAKRAQFYAAEVLLALKYFHENGIIYRDLKLDNILLGLDGHIKIADYGLCKEDMWHGKTTSTFCGTPEFMAPEILLEQRYGRAVDWWAFGVLIYQMLLGQSPFRGDDEDEIFDAILADEPLYPIHMPRDSVSILQKLLTREPERRLGSGEGDAADVMAHPYFRNINWDDMYNKRVPPPFCPTLQSATDTSNFDTEFTREVPVLTPVQSVLTQANQEQFRGFSYVCEEQ
ncbi:hypothetical protein SAICODRAFT_58541 [Saitoella complicata NRRL Y-17804]|uniref:uncharacterized protein n=1 Tax=Saitoella complicata (strain BCRC 22490 / CBS 7301 / JCM 7358 / NBRC 10748 / NRRL Y-17804) TaxID=698492 RepID=UPI0008678EAB|nr:uncharacterized protein SAICODRAFT_58541 [Saitoella complicata NRRL Y-17804]ODQ52114.1 hypothetical protein SAICODRAFT_58541 [Saitoella complicata NRRL Y-17804]